MDGEPRGRKDSTRKMMHARFEGECEAEALLCKINMKGCSCIQEVSMYLSSHILAQVAVRTK